VHDGKNLAPLPDKPEPLGPFCDKSGAYRVHCFLAGSLEVLVLVLAAASLVRDFGNGASGSRAAVVFAVDGPSAVGDADAFAGAIAPDALVLSSFAASFTAEAFVEMACGDDLLLSADVGFALPVVNFATLAEVMGRRGSSETSSLRTGAVLRLARCIIPPGR
jgi:hypothetical protein